MVACPSPVSTSSLFWWTGSFGVYKICRSADLANGTSVVHLTQTLFRTPFPLR